MSSENDKIYFAAHEDPTKVAAKAFAKGQSFYDTLRANAYLEKVQRMWRFYHGDFTQNLGYGHSIEFGGEQGEYVHLMVNHFRNLAKHMHTIVTANRPTLEARAVNTDYSSLSQTYLANGILDYYLREKGLEDILIDAAEMAIVLGASFVKMEWNATAGDQYDFDEETGQYITEGEMEFSLHSPLDVVFDGTKDRFQKEWVLVRSFQNRHNLKAKYPEYAEKLDGVANKNSGSVYRLAIFSNDDTDDIPVYEFYHERCEALPDGRYMLFASEDIVLIDAPLPYRQVPIFRMAPDNIMGTPYGYSPLFDIFPIQQAINSLYSTVMTNQTALGVQSVYVPRGADLNMVAFDGGMNVIEGNAKPEPLNLTETPAEIFKFIEMLRQDIETITGINSVTRGNPEASLRTGNALALVQSQSIQFLSGIQRSYTKLIEDVGTALIATLKDYATTPKVVALVGKNNRPFLKEFTGEQISSINRVVVNMANPLSRTIAGRVEMANNLLQMNLIRNPQQYLQIMNTGNLDSIHEGEMDELLLIKKENEMLIDSQEPLVSPLDSHRMHINEHKAVLADPDLRQNPDFIALVMNHIEEHLNMLKNTDPDLLALINEQPLQPPPPQLPPGAEGVNPEMIAPDQGLTVPGEQMSGPGITNQSLPQTAKVDASALINPELQEQVMGNVRPR